MPASLEYTKLRNAAAHDGFCNFWIVEENYTCDEADKRSCYYYYGVIMGAMTFQITSLTIVSTTVYSDADKRKHQSPTSLAFVRGLHRGPVNSPHKWPVTRKMFPFYDVIM